MDHQESASAPSEGEAGHSSETLDEIDNNTPATSFLDFKLEPEELLNAPRGERVKTDIAFGDNGTIAYINEYGELLVMMKYVGVGESGMITAAPKMSESEFGVELGRRLESRGNGIGLRLWSGYNIERLHIEFVHDRWPRISFILPNIASVTVHCVVRDGCFLQQYIVKSLSDEAKVELLFRVDFEIGIWPTAFWEQPYDTYTVESINFEPDSTHRSAQLKGEPLPDDEKFSKIGEVMLNVALFENGNLVKLAYDEDINPYDWHLSIAKGETRELMAKYHLGALNSTIEEPEPVIERYNDVCAFLRQDKHGIWTHNGPEDSFFVLRRYLEHILSVCAIPIPRRDTKQKAVAFTDGEMIEPFISHLGNFYQIQFLLLMHEALEGGITDPGLKEYLQARIKNACMGLIEWWYNVAECDPVGGWHRYSHPCGKCFGTRYDGETIRSPYLVLLLYEFLRTFSEEQDFVLDKIKNPRIVAWLEGLERRRHEKSNLWVCKETDQSVDWYDREFREDDQVKVSHFRLSQLAVIWRTLQFLQKVCETRESREILSIQHHPGKGAKGNISSPTAPLSTGLTSTSFMRRGSTSNATGDADTKDSAVKEIHGKDSETKDPATKDPLEEINSKMSEEPQSDARNVINNHLQNLDPAGIRSKAFDRFSFTPHTSAADADPRTAKIRLAVCRSAISQEPRTHFHASDTALFDAVEWGFFDDESLEGLLPAWTETVGIQDKKDKDWDTPLRYALALRMADQDQAEKKEVLNVETKKALVGPGDGVPTIRKQEAQSKPLVKSDMSTAGAVAESKPSTKEDGHKKQGKGKGGKLQGFRQILMESVLSNGLFAHELDISKRPVRDLNFDKTYKRYDIARILLRFDLRDYLLIRRDQKIHMSFPDVAKIDDDEKRKEIRRIRKAREGKMASISQAGKKRIVEYPEPEWLYGDPAFFRGYDTAEFGQDWEPCHADSLLPENLLNALQQQEELSSDNNIRALAINVRRNLTLKTISKVRSLWRKQPIVCARDLDQFLRRERTRDKAKKQLIMLDAGTIEAFLVLYIRCPTSERSSMAGFLDHHAKFSNAASEMTCRLANLWITEFHISFYKMFQLGSNDIDLHDSTKFVKYSVELTLHVPFASYALVKATQGFRMVGDMFDRSWTCWVLSRVPGKTRRVPAFDGSSLSEDSSTGLALSWMIEIDDPSWHHWLSRGKDGFHAQRRVLELRLFAKMAKEASESTDEILNRVDSYLRYEAPKPSESGNDSTFITLSKLNLDIYSQIIHILKNLQKNAEAIRNAAKDWEDRGSESLEKPRWSESDESQYGTKLNHELRRSRRIIDELREQEEKIKNKISEVERLNESTLSELSVNITIVQSRTDENVRLFTYATVVFLPLSFSSSIFSMAGSPSNPTVKSFAVAVIITLLVTVLFLVNIRALARGFEAINEAYVRAAQPKMMKSKHPFWRHKAQALHEQRRRQRGDPHLPFPQGPEDFIPPKEPTPPSKLWYMWFWISYASLIFPASRIALALESLPLTRGKYKHEKAHNSDAVRLGGKGAKEKAVEGEKSTPLPRNKLDVGPENRNAVGEDLNKSLINQGESFSDRKEVFKNKDGLVSAQIELPNQQGTISNEGGSMAGDHKSVQQNQNASDKVQRPPPLPFRVWTLRLLVALLVLPIFTTTHLILFVVWNVKDLVALLVREFSSSPEAASKESLADTTSDENTITDKDTTTDENCPEHDNLATLLSRPVRLKELWIRKSKSATPPLARNGNSFGNPFSTLAHTPSAAHQQEEIDIEAQAEKQKRADGSMDELHDGPAPPSSRGF